MNKFLKYFLIGFGVVILVFVFLAVIGFFKTSKVSTVADLCYEQPSQLPGQTSEWCYDISELAGSSCSATRLQCWEDAAQHMENLSQCEAALKQDERDVCYWTLGTINGPSDFRNLSCGHISNATMRSCCLSAEYYVISGYEYCNSQ